MEALPKHPRLMRRGSTYYHRASVPVDIQSTYPKTEETFSLGTKDPREATRLLRIAAAKVDRKFEAHRQSLSAPEQPLLKELTDEQVRHIQSVYFTHLLEEDDEIRLSGFEDRPFEEWADDTEWFKENAQHGYARGQVEVFFDDEVEEVLSWSNVNLRLDRSSRSWKKVARALQAATIQAAKAQLQRNEGEVVETPLPSDDVKPSSQGPLFSVAVESWAREKVRTSWVEKTEREHRVWTGHFEAINGDKPIGSYSKTDARRFKEMLLDLPPNWNKDARLKKLTVEKAAETARTLDMATMSDNNVNKIIGFVSAFWSWAAENYDEAPPQPFKGLKIRTKRQVREERDPFDASDLNAIFAAPLYTGCKSLSSWKQPGDLVAKDAGIFWVPLISLFSGARLGEIVQLYTADVRTEDGVTFFDINVDGEDKRLKNSNSKRRIPVHPTLMEIGFGRLLAMRQESGSQRLFPDLRRGEDGYYSSPFSKHFSRFLRSVGVKNPKTAFHSFRHSFEDACRNSGVPHEVMDALQGHGESGMSARYGKGYMLKKLNETMQTVRYEGVDLSHLEARD